MSPIALIQVHTAPRVALWERVGVVGFVVHEPYLVLEAACRYHGAPGAPLEELEPSSLGEARLVAQHLTEEDRRIEARRARTLSSWE